MHFERRTSCRKKCKNLDKLFTVNIYVNRKFYIYCLHLIKLMALRLTSSLTRGLYKNILQRGILNPTQNMQRSTRYLSGMSDQFNRAKENVSTLTQDPGNEVKLKMYALFKQVMLGRLRGGGGV